MTLQDNLSSNLNQNALQNDALHATQHPNQNASTINPMKNTSMVKSIMK